MAASVVGAGGGSLDAQKIVQQAITTQKSETPFGDLAELEELAATKRERRWAGDWVDFDEGEEDEMGGGLEEEEDDEEGEDVPITMGLDLGRGKTRLPERRDEAEGHKEEQVINGKDKNEI